MACPNSSGFRAGLREDGPMRSCDGCTLCCKLMEIEELAKHPGKWCDHCEIGTGCRIYSERPASCAGFTCGFLSWPPVPTHWHPKKCKMVITMDKPGQVVVRVDDGRPDAWKAEPFYSDLKSWARMGGPEQQLLVHSKGRTIAIVPDADINLGIVGKNDVLITSEIRTPTGRRWVVEKASMFDSRITGVPVCRS